jgi:hypothetical protein
MDTTEFLSRLKGVKPNGSGWSALYPAQENHTASLSIVEGDKGIVIGCHASASPMPPAFNTDRREHRVIDRRTDAQTVVLAWGDQHERERR